MLSIFAMDLMFYAADVSFENDGETNKRIEGEHSMKEIQIDMFEVQLGAAVLLQFKRDDERWIAVLADAGVDTSAHPVDYVHNKLVSASILQTQARFPHQYRIDLIIGTHYDKDHLAGLVPIIEDDQFDIGEAWLPPVANDTELHAIDDPLYEMNLMAFQFAQQGGAERLNRYLKKKERVCREMSTMLHAAALKSNNVTIELDEHMVRSIEEVEKRDIEEPDEAWFEDYLKEAAEIIGEEAVSHVGAEVESLEGSEAFQTSLDDHFGSRWYGPESFGEYKDRV